MVRDSTTVESHAEDKWDGIDVRYPAASGALLQVDTTL